MKKNINTKTRTCLQKVISLVRQWWNIRYLKVKQVVNIRREVFRIIKDVVNKSKVNPLTTLHTLCFIQKLMGHQNLKTTKIYIHLASEGFNEITSPLED